MSTLTMITPTRSEFEVRIEAVEARMDTRIATIIARLDAFEIRSEERERRIEARLDERDKRLDERDKRLDERDKRLDLIVQRADAALARTSHLTTHMWLAASTVILAVAGMVVGAYHAAQSSHLGMTQTVISAFELGQKSQSPVKE